MGDIHRSQYRMPFSLFEKLKAEADRAGRSVNAELVGRLERTLLGSSNEIDIRHIFEALERLSARNPDMRYTFSFNLGGELEGSSPHIQNGKWTLPANAPATPLD
ncbi:Arc family DNA-binding protein [Pseudoduganella sp. FT26W]|uniref:Arc family DNA-binding protein n=2 Tax=Duganella aquatilis TaxID=2666082 RepID=A0A844DBT4_9BURK|nr:Arc family DNA-binding protein [Duganella aquatilis]MRW85846.1 Arc family DNA-binding protein [Duganella aquatilis]